VAKWWLSLKSLDLTSAEKVQSCRGWSPSTHRSITFAAFIPCRLLWGGAADLLFDMAIRSSWVNTKSKRDKCHNARAQNWTGSGLLVVGAQLDKLWLMPLAFFFISSYQTKTMWNFEEVCRTAENRNRSTCYRATKMGIYLNSQRVCCISV